MGKKLCVGLFVLVSLCNVALADRIVDKNGLYRTIQQAITAAGNNEKIIIMPGIHNVEVTLGGVSEPNGFDLGNKTGLTFMAANPSAVATTIIDCRNLGRAFAIATANSAITIKDLTIRNGYMPGSWGVDGNDTDPNGKSVDANGFGGAILINANNAAISNCVFENCSVSGGKGGLGHKGSNGFGTGETADGNDGGIGGEGEGDGRGGAIFVATGINPIISNCTFMGCSATGGIGGDGGDGGTPATGGKESSGGDAGDGSGNGFGGAIYVAAASQPDISNCSFINNTAKGGIAGTGGSKVSGASADPRARNGFDGASSGYGNAGVCYFEAGADANFVNCTFSGNTSAGAAAVILTSNNCTGSLTNCTFVNNEAPGSPGGAVLAINSTLSFFNSNFSSNLASSGGAIESFNGSLNIDHVSFSGNNADGTDGGAINSSGTTITMLKSVFANNIATQFGGAIYTENGDTFDANFCNFSDNSALAGGAVVANNVTANVRVTNCNWIANQSQNVGALWISSAADFYMDRTSFANNSASGDNAYAGALRVSMGPADIHNCSFTGNISNGTSSGDGGAIYFELADSVTMSNCLVANNFATGKGGGVAFTLFSGATLSNCTVADNIANVAGGGLFCDWSSTCAITNSIFANCNNWAIYDENSDNANIAISYTLFYHNAPGDFLNNATLPGYSGSSVPGTENITGDPKFVFPDYYLGTGSAAIDVGDGTAASLGLTGYSPYSSGAPDTNNVDLGFHYIDPNTIPKYTLTVSVTGGHGQIQVSDRNGVIRDSSYQWPEGSIATLTAIPDAGYRVKGWTGGTADDAGKARTNTIAMISNRTVSVEFEQPKTWAVNGGTDTREIQDVIDMAADGDTVVVASGTYSDHTSIGFPSGVFNLDKSIILKSDNPDDPNSVIIQASLGGGHGQNCITIGSNADEYTLIQGFTFVGENVFWGDGANGVNPGDDGSNVGGNLQGGGIYVAPLCKARVVNCVVRDATLTGSKGGNGAAADEINHAGRGGWGNATQGAGIYISTNAKPRFERVTVKNCNAIGGSGGNAGAPSATRFGNYGGMYSESGAVVYHYTSSFRLSATETLWHYWGYIGEPRWYTAFGGGAYCATGSAPEFVNCTFMDNSVKGGMTGTGTSAVSGHPIMPSRAYMLPSYGGGVYCQIGANAVFTNCQFTNNSAFVPTTENVWNPHTGQGGAICCEDASAKFVNCSFGSNSASNGGAIYGCDSNEVVVDCNFNSNKAYQGGAIFVDGSNAMIAGSNFNLNSADKGTGSGGALYSFNTDSYIADCVFSNNDSNSSGGAIYFGGTGGPAEIMNSLFTNNKAISDGGAITCSSSVQALITNSTFAGNQAVSGSAITYGGAISTSDGANTTIYNSILWGNLATNGNELSVGKGFSLNPVNPSGTIVRYSDVKGGAVMPASYVEGSCPFSLDSTNLNGTGLSDPKFVNGYYLSSIAAGQSANSPCIDKGSGTASILPMGAFRYTTSTKFTNDTGAIDMGYHYRKPGRFTFGDLNYDGVVSSADLDICIAHWLDGDCGIPGFCEGADINMDTVVNNKDYAVLVTKYGTGDIEAPLPDPSTWEVPPTSAGTGSIHFTATTSYDNSGNAPYYRYIRLDTSAMSAWQLNPSFTVTGLTSLTTSYGFQVQAKDETGNMTGWSRPGYAVPGADTTPPSPNPPVWAVAPHRVSTTNSISMQVSSVTDAANSLPIMYRFTRTSSLGNVDTGWVDYTTFTESGLISGVSYTYRVRAKDGVGNETADSTASTVTIGSTEPNTPPPPVTTVAPRKPCISSSMQTTPAYTHRLVIRTVNTDINGNSLVGHNIKYTVTPSGAGCTGLPTVTKTITADAAITSTTIDVYVGPWPVSYNTWKVKATDVNTNLNSDESAGAIIGYGDCQ